MFLSLDIPAYANADSHPTSIAHEQASCSKTQTEKHQAWTKITECAKNGKVFKLRDRMDGISPRENKSLDSSIKPHDAQQY